MSDKPFITDDEIRALLSVQETARRISFRMSYHQLSVEICGIKLGVDESLADAFIRCFSLSTIREIRVQEFCSMLLAQADKHSVELAAPVMNSLHSLAIEIPKDDRLTIDVVVEIIHGLVRGGFTLDAIADSVRTDILMGYSDADQSYTGDGKIIRYLAPRTRAQKE